MIDINYATQLTVRSLALASLLALIACQAGDGTSSSSKESESVLQQSKAETDDKSSSTFINAVLTKSPPIDGIEIDIATLFSPPDTVYAVAVIEGKGASPANVRAEIISSMNNEKVAESNKTSSATGRTMVSLELRHQEGGWEKGKYLTRFYLNEVPSWELNFEVAK